MYRSSMSRTLFTLSGKCRGAFEKRCFLRYFLKTGVFFENWF